MNAKHLNFLFPCLAAAAWLGGCSHTGRVPNSGALAPQDVGGEIGEGSLGDRSISCVYVDRDTITRGESSATPKEWLSVAIYDKERARSAGILGQIFWYSGSVPRGTLDIKSSEGVLDKKGSAFERHGSELRHLLMPVLAHDLKTTHNNPRTRVTIALPAKTTLLSGPDNGKYITMAYLSIEDEPYYTASLYGSCKYSEHVPGQ
jgi:hypothetical protein